MSEQIQYILIYILQKYISAHLWKTRIHVAQNFSASEKVVYQENVPQICY